MNRIIILIIAILITIGINYMLFVPDTHVDKWFIVEQKLLGHSIVWFAPHESLITDDEDVQLYEADELLILKRIKPDKWMPRGQRGVDDSE